MGSRRLQLLAVIQHNTNPVVQLEFTRPLTMLEVAGIKSTIDSMLNANLRLKGTSDGG